MLLQPRILHRAAHCVDGFLRAEWGAAAHRLLHLGQVVGALRRGAVLAIVFPPAARLLRLRIVDFGELLARQAQPLLLALVLRQVGQVALDFAAPAHAPVREGHHLVRWRIAQHQGRRLVLRFLGKAVGAGGRITGQIVGMLAFGAAAANVGARAHNTTSDSTFHTGARHAVPDIFALGIVLPHLLLGGLGQLLQHGLGHHAASNAPGQRLGAALCQPPLASVDDGSFCRFQAQLVGHSAADGAQRTGADASAQGCQRVLLLVVALVLGHLLSSGDGTFTGAGGNGHGQLLAHRALKVAGDSSPSCSAAGISRCAGHCTGAHYGAPDQAARHHARQGFCHLASCVARVLQVGLGNGAYIALLPGFVDRLAALLMPSGELGFVGPLSRLEACGLADGVSCRRHWPRAAHSSNRKIHQASSHAWQALHAYLDGLG
ncbi:hypothetical protein [Comamonas sp.]|uniref:hypothetical protein n=1 Tax=Comamonas sp. TaxID=34028 RepID=UPI003D131AE7